MNRRLKGMDMLRGLVATLVLGLAVALGAAPLAPATAQAPTELDSAASDTEITAGQSVKLTATLTSNTVAVSDRTVSLERKPYGEDTFQWVADVETQSGKASLDVFPDSRTVYRWTFAGDDTYGPVTSNWTTVRVHVKVTLKLQDEVIGSGQQMVARGMTTPNKAGSAIYLYRKTISGTPQKWLTRTVRSDGSYRFAKRVGTTNRYELFAVVPSGTGTLRGQSPSVTLFIGA